MNKFAISLSIYCHALIFISIIILKIINNKSLGEAYLVTVHRDIHNPVIHCYIELPDQVLKVIVAFERICH
jgi:hypothetical protein